MAILRSYFQTLSHFKKFSKELSEKSAMSLMKAQEVAALMAGFSSFHEAKIALEKLEAMPKSQDQSNIMIMDLGGSAIGSWDRLTKIVDGVKFKFGSIGAPRINPFAVSQNPTEKEVSDIIRVLDLMLANNVTADNLSTNFGYLFDEGELRDLIKMTLKKPRKEIPGPEDEIEVPTLSSFIETIEEEQKRREVAGEPDISGISHLLTRLKKYCTGYHSSIDGPTKIYFPSDSIIEEDGRRKIPLHFDFTGIEDTRKLKILKLLVKNFMKDHLYDEETGKGVYLIK